MIRMMKDDADDRNDMEVSWSQSQKSSFNSIMYVYYRNWKFLFLKVFIWSILSMQTSSLKSFVLHPSLCINIREYAKEQDPHMHWAMCGGIYRLLKLPFCLNSFRSNISFLDSFIKKRESWFVSLWICLDFRTYIYLLVFWNCSYISTTRSHSIV